MLADTDINMRGFLPEIVRIATKYGLVEYLENYCLRTEFPEKLAWKRIVKRSVDNIQVDLYISGLEAKGAGRVARVHSQLRPFALYGVAKRNPQCKHQILRLAKLLTFPVSIARCPLCNRVSNDMVQHVIVYCGSLVALRNQMWDNLTDILGVHYAMTLFQKCDALYM